MDGDNEPDVEDGELEFLKSSVQVLQTHVACFTDADRKVFDRFARVARNAHRTRFWQTLPEASRAEFVTKKNGIEWKTGAYDVELFRSFMLEYRKLFLLNDDPTVVPHILSLLRRRAGEDLAPVTTALTQRMKAAKRDEDAAFFFAIGPNLQASARITPFNLLLALTNGEWFHTDEKHAATVEVFRGMEVVLIAHAVESLVETMNVAFDTLYLLERAGLVASGS